MNGTRSTQSLSACLADNPRSGGIGILYFAWQQPSGRQVQQLFHRKWAAFAERKSRELRLYPGIPAAWRWLNRDLFLFINLPYGDEMQNAEWLLSASRQLRDEWETSFRQAPGMAEPDITLHAGVSILDPNAAALGSDNWYESMKRAVLHGHRTDSVERSLRRLTFDRMMREEAIYPVYQPIVSLEQGGVFGYEALTRCPGNAWFAGPLPLFSFADEEGESYLLDRLSREKAILGCRELGAGQKLFINVMPHLMDDPRFTPGRTLRLLEQRGLSPENVVFELTERSSIEDFAACSKMLAHYRSQGYQIAIDDVGAGYSSLQSIVELRPDFIKVDRSLVSGIHLDEMKAEIMGTFVSFAARMGIGVIAEGIEEPEELTAIRGMGVHYAQGYLLGRPAAQ